MSSLALTLPLDPVKEFQTPEVPFFGSITLCVKTASPWVCDFGNGYLLEITPPDARNDDWIHQAETSLRLFRRDSDSQFVEIVPKRTLQTEGNDISGLKIVSDVNSAILYINNGQNPFLKDEVTIPRLAAGNSVKVFTSGKYRFEKAECVFEEYPEGYKVENYHCEATDSKSHAGVWEYLDRITPKDGSVVLSERYKLAAVDDPEVQGNILLVYLDSENSRSELWHPGDVKAILTPTGFENHYNLEWFDSHKRPVGGGENSATFEGYNLLTLDLPLLGVQIRFQRIISD